MVGAFAVPPTRSPLDGVKGADTMGVSHARSRLVLSLLLTVVMTLTWVPFASARTSASYNQVRLQILAVNDFHGQLEPYSSALGGAALLGGYLDARETSTKGGKSDTLRLGVGDLIGASPPSSALLQDEPTMQVLDAMGFDYSTVGNHEFDEGIAELLRLQYGGFSAITGRSQRTHMKYLAANVVRESTGKTVFPPYVIEHVNGVHVGIIGVVYEGTPSIVTASGVAGLAFLGEAETVNRYVAELKRRGVETIIVLLHNGGAGTTTGGPITGDIVPVVEAMDDEVDVVLSAHSHNRYWGYIDGKLVTGAHSAGRAFADVELVLDRKTGDVVSKSAEIVPVASGMGVVPNARVAKIVSAAAAKVAPVVSRVIGTASGDITRTQNTAGESALGSFVADAQRWKHSTQISIMNPGGIRADVLAGEVTWGELFTVQPFSNYLVTMNMTGAQLDDLLERQWLGQGTAIKMLQISGISYSWSASAPVGSKVDPASILVGGMPVDPAGVYSVTANNFLAEGGDNFSTFRLATDKVFWGSDLDALVDYVGQLAQPFSASIVGRATLLP